MIIAANAKQIHEQCVPAGGCKQVFAWPLADGFAVNCNTIWMW